METLKTRFIFKLTILLAIVLPLCFMTSCHKKNELRPIIDYKLFYALKKFHENRKDYFPTSRFDTIRVEDCNYRIIFSNVYRMSTFPFYFIWEDANNAGDKQLSRYSEARNKFVQYYFFEFPRGMWHNYIRVKMDLDKHSNEKKCFVIRWCNREIESAIEDYDSYAPISASVSYNWGIDQFTDTIYSTLPKHAIEREFPEFRGVYKYLDLKQITLDGIVNYTNKDSLPDMIKFEYNK